MKGTYVFEIPSEILIDYSSIDRLQNQVKSRRKAFRNILEYLDQLDDAISYSDSDSDRYEYANVNEYPRAIIYYSFGESLT